MSLLLILTSSLILGSFVQESDNMRVSMSRESDRCHPYKVTKTFRMTDPTTYKPCTLEIPSVICAGFCKTETGIKSSEQTADPRFQYRLEPEPDCKCCEPKHARKLYPIPPMTLSCLEGHKWNQTVKLQAPADDCRCRPCTSSRHVN